MTPPASSGVELAIFGDPPAAQFSDQQGIQPAAGSRRISVQGNR
jgi:hypothetical protein